MKSSSALLFASTVLLSSPVAAAGPNVVASIKPVHSLVASIMQGVGEPSLIVEGAASPHTYNMKPSNAAALQAAKVVFWVGPGLEAFLDKPLDALSGGAKVVELSEAPGLEKLKFREGGAFEAHDHDDEGHGEEGHKHAEGEAEHDDAAAPEAAAADDHDHAHEGHDHEGFDMHLWLDPQNARAMAAEIEKTLTEADPDNAGAYKANLEKLNQRLDALDKSLVATVAPVKDKPFVVFHDAYQYFEHRYQVRVVGLDHGQPGGSARRRSAVADPRQDQGTGCDLRLCRTAVRTETDQCGDRRHAGEIRDARSRGGHARCRAGPLLPADGRYRHVAQDLPRLGKLIRAPKAA